MVARWVGADIVQTLLRKHGQQGSRMYGYKLEEGGAAYHANITLPLLRLEIDHVILMTFRTFFAFVWQLWTRAGQPMSRRAYKYAYQKRRNKLEAQRRCHEALEEWSRSSTDRSESFPLGSPQVEHFKQLPHMVQKLERSSPTVGSLATYAFSPMDSWAASLRICRYVQAGSLCWTDEQALQM